MKSIQIQLLHAEEIRNQMLRNTFSLELVISVFIFLYLFISTLISAQAGAHVSVHCWKIKNRKKKNIQKVAHK